MTDVRRWPNLQLAHDHSDIAEAEGQIAAIRGRVDRLDGAEPNARALLDILTELRTMIQRHRAARERIAKRCPQDED